MDSPHHDIAIIGLGYVGLPLAVHIGNTGYRVLGLDLDVSKIESINNGISYIPDVSSNELAILLKKQMITAAVPTEQVAKVNTIIVTVPTPVTKGEKKPDLSALISATQFISKHLQSGQTIIYESSTYPGTLEEMILPILSSSGLQVGIDYHLCYSPERIDPGNTAFHLSQIPKVVSGQTPACLEKVIRLYGKVFETIVPVSSPKVAEMCKIFENIQRLVNISLVNEINTICSAMNVNFREALAAASTKPFGFTPFYPGPGIGGHCIPVDPLYFQWKAKDFNLSSALIEEALNINARMPKEIVKQIEEMQPKENETRHSTILLIGLTYKKDVNDVRESPAIEVFELLLQEGYNVLFHDPLIPEWTIDNQKRVSQSLTQELLQQADIVVILTDHTRVDWKLVLDNAKHLIDTRGVYVDWQESDTI